MHRLAVVALGASLGHAITVETSPPGARRQEPGAWLGLHAHADAASRMYQPGMERRFWRVEVGARAPGCQRIIGALCPVDLRPDGP